MTKAHPFAVGAFAGAGLDEAPEGGEAEGTVRLGDLAEEGAGLGAIGGGGGGGRDEAGDEEGVGGVGGFELVGGAGAGEGGVGTKPTDTSTSL